MLRVIPFSQVEDYLNMPDNYEPPQCEDGERGHLRSWLGDKKSRDQFVIMVDDVVYIYWNNKGNPPDIDCSRKVIPIFSCLCMLILNFPLELDRILCHVVSAGNLSHNLS